MVRTAVGRTVDELVIYLLVDLKKIPRFIDVDNRIKNIKDKVKKVSNKKFKYRLFNEIYKLYEGIKQ